MTEDQFWYAEEKLLYVYQRAYIRDKTYSAWLFGMHNCEATRVAVQNSMRTKENDPILKYGDYKDPFEISSKPKVTKENIEEEFRKQHAMQNAWLKNLIKK